jgi:hypothetical protein
MSLFILTHVFGFDSLRSKWNTPISFFLFLLKQLEVVFHSFPSVETAMVASGRATRVNQQQGAACFQERGPRVLGVVRARPCQF